MCELYLLSVFDRVLPILPSSMQAYVYTILCFSEISLQRADILPDFTVLTSPHERSADTIPLIVDVTLQSTTPKTLVDSKDYLLCHR